MTMLNQAHVEAICSATYLENYLDCLDTLPDDLQRILTQMREVDVRLTDLENQTTPFEEVFTNVKSEETLDQKFVNQLQRMLISMQELQDEKINLTYSLMELIENRTKQLEADRENLDPANHMVNDAPTPPPKNHTSGNKKNCNTTSGDTKSTSAVQSSTSSHSVDSSKDASRQVRATVNDHRVSINSAKKRKQKPDTPISASKSVSIASKSNHSTVHTHNNGGATGSLSASKDETPAKKQSAAAAHDETKSNTKLPNKRKRRSRAKTKEVAKEPSPGPEEEPTYCVCHQISYGEMIGCDNDVCPIEWFHFNCVNLTNKPKGKWYCPRCRGDKPTVMKKGADKVR